MSDGARLHELWTSALSEAATTLKGLLGSSGWVRVNTSNNPNNVSLHKKGNVLRALVEIEDEKYPGIDDWRAVFGSVELRKEWDLMVDKARVLEVLDPNTRVVKTDYALGWPANPRDAITISRTVYDASTVVNVSTSLPRSPDEPAYLRPSPPYVRSHVHLQAWCVQLPTPTSSKTRITLFWQHDLRNAFTLSSSSPNTTLPTLLPAIYSVASQGAPRAPLVQRWGPRSVIDAVSYDTGRAALRVDYTILPDDEHGDSGLVAGQREVEIWISPSHAWEAQISTRAASEAVSNLPWTVNAAKSGPSDEAGERTVMRVTHSPVPSNSASSLKVKLVIELGGGSKGTLRINGALHSVSAARLAPRPMIESGFAPSVGAEILSVFGPGVGSTEKGTGSAKSTPAPSIQSGAASITSTIPSVSAPSTRTAAAQKSIQTLIRRSYTYFTALLQEPDAKWRPLLESRGVTVTQLDSIDPTLVVFRAEATFVGVGLWDILGVLGCEPARGVWEKGVEDVKLVEDVGELSELWRVGWKAAWPVNPRDTILLKTSYKSSTAAHVFSFSTTDSTLFPLIPPPELPTIRTHTDLHGFAIEALSPTTTLLTLLEQSSSSSTAWTGRGSGGVPASMVATLAGIGEMVIKGGGAPPVVSRLSGARKGRVRYDHDRGMWRVEYERSEPRAGNEEKKSDKSASQSTSGAESDEEGGEMGASIATLIPTSGSKRGSSLSSSPDSMAGRSSAPSTRTSLALSISPTKGIVFPSTESANNSSSTINGPTNSSNSASNAQLVELELRVDPDSWSPLELVIDPPPSAVRALKRHRLARGGGGLWITVEHAPSQLSSAYGSAINGINYGGLGGWDDRISVTVRKSSPASSSPKESPTTPVSSRDRDTGSEWEDASSGGEGLKTPIRTAREELLKFQGDRARVDSTTKSIKSERPTHERSNSLLTAPRISTARTPTLIVNGARVKVEVEELPEAEIKALSKAKRVKPKRIPLDEPPVMWKKRGRTNTTEEDSASGVGEGVGTDTEEAEVSPGPGVVKSVVNWGMGMGSLGIGMGGLGKMWGPAGANVGVGNPGTTDEPGSVLGITAPGVQSGVETAITSVAQPSTLLRLVTNTGTPISSAPVSSIPAGERPPMASALDALAFLTRQHTNNPTPDSIPTAGGWTAVSTKAGLTVTRRTEPAFSTSLPVHRCSKVLQGVSAEDVASAISCSESRTQWDTWFDGGASVVLEEYGAGARTEFSVLKGGFPFRDRGFYVSTLTARAAAGPGTPGLIFLTSASYNNTTQHFSPGKVNVYSLPVGQMPLYGWVIETLDPYTAENYAIPSARCTLYVCVDYGGQVPVAYNTMVNSTLPRASITAVEAFLGAGSRPSIPIVRYPSSIMAVKGVTEDEAYQKKGRELVWTIGHEDTRRSYLGSSYNQTTNVFQANIKMNPHTFRPPPSPIQPPMSAIEPSSTSSLLTVSSRSRKVSNNGGGNGTSGGSSTSLGRSSGSRFRSRARTLSSNARPPDVNAEGLTVAEFVLDTRLFPAGYDVTTASMFLPEGSTPPVPFIMSNGSAATTTRVLPLRVQVYTVPLSPLRASATTTTQSTRQLIRITLPSTPHATPDVLDPLTGETRRGVEEPEWIKRLVTEQAIVRVTIGPSAIKDKIRVDGTITEVLSEKKSIVALGRAVLEEEHVGYSLLSRTKSGGGSSVPDSLSSPVAAATHLYSDEPMVKSTPIPAMVQIVEEPAPVESAVTEDASASTPKYPSRPSQSRRPSASLFGFLSAYTNPVTKMPAITDDKREPNPPIEPPAPSPSTPEPASSSAESAQANQKIMFEHRHSNATLIIVAVIAFLVGSLLRSLISPADFIYMGAPKSPNEHLDAENWRQVKRLVEIKYGWWGWDFVVAVVRRP